MDRLRMTCALLKISRSNLYYSHKMPVKDAPVIEAMKTLSGVVVLLPFSVHIEEKQRV